MVSENINSYQCFSDLYFAVFNSSKYDHIRARKATIERFGVEGWAKVRAASKTGIMEIFCHLPTPELVLYAETAGRLAEARCAKRKANGLKTG